MRLHLIHRQFTFGIFSLTLILTTLFLGFWQLERLEEKQLLLKNIHKAMNAKSIPLDIATDQLLNDESERIYHRPVHFEGTFLPDKVVTISPRTHKGRPGVFTLVPVSLHAGATILINLGWSEKAIPLQLPTKKVSLEGFLQASEENDSLFSLPNTPDKMQWHAINIKEISHHFGLNMNLPFFINIKQAPSKLKIKVDEKTSSTPQQNINEMLLPQVHFPNIPNNHFTYALTWFALAFFLTLGYGYFLKITFSGKQHRNSRFS